MKVGDLVMVDGWRVGKLIEVFSDQKLGRVLFPGGRCYYYYLDELEVAEDYEVECTV